jgi:hypothetical protein
VIFPYSRINFPLILILLCFLIQVRGSFVRLCLKVGLLLFSAISNSSMAKETESRSNDPESGTNNRQFLIEVPGNIDISPAVIFRYLAEKFANMSNEQNKDKTADYLIHSKQTATSLSNMIGVESSRDRTPHIDHSLDNSNSSSEVSSLAVYGATYFSFYA